MKKIITQIALLFTVTCFVNSQNIILSSDLQVSDYASPDEILQFSDQNFNSQTQKMQWCATGSTLSSGYPAWSNYYAGWMVNINNVSSNTITISCFEARFQGNTGYRIYTKAGTFVGSEANAGAWTLVGTANNVASISTTTSSPIPIAVNVNINPGTTQAFYLTRTDNVVANRHLYITGSGTAGTTVYMSDANIQVTEATYCDVYFIPQTGVRRPSFQVYYSIYNPLPVELGKAKCTSNETSTKIEWETFLEKNNNYFAIERSLDGVSFEELGRVKGAFNSSTKLNYSFEDNSVRRGVNYYRIKQVDANENYKYYDLITCLYEPEQKSINIYSITGLFITQIVSDDYKTAMQNLEVKPGLYLLEFKSSSGSSFIKYFKQ